MPRSSAGSTNTLVRLEPVNSVKRIAEDHIGFSGHVTGIPGNGADGESRPDRCLTSKVPSRWRPTSSVHAAGCRACTCPAGGGLSTVNPFTGQVETYVGDPVGWQQQRAGYRHAIGWAAVWRRIVARNRQYRRSRHRHRLVQCGPDVRSGNDSIPDYDANTNPPDPQQLTSDAVDALAYVRTGADGAGVPEYALFYAVRGIRVGGATLTGSTLYRANPANGSAAVVQNQPWGVRGGIYENTPGDVGTTTGLAFVGGSAVRRQQHRPVLHGFDGNVAGRSNVVNVGPSFAGLTAGPQNLQDGSYASTLFAVDNSGTPVCSRYLRPAAEHIHRRRHVGQYQRGWRDGPGLFVRRHQPVASDDAASRGCGARDQPDL